MGLDESLFGFGYKKAQRLRALCATTWSLKRRREVSAIHHDAPQESQATLETQQTRLQLLACMIAEEPIRVRPAHEGGKDNKGSKAQHSEGGWSGSTVWLPDRIVVSPNHEALSRAYAWRVAYSLQSRALGFTMPTSDALDGIAVAHTEAQTLFSLLSVPATEQTLFTTHPSLKSTAQVLYDTHLAYRSLVLDDKLLRRFSDRHLALELLLRLRLASNGSNLALETLGVQRQRALEFAISAAECSPLTQTQLVQKGRVWLSKLAELPCNRTHASPELSLWGVLWPHTPNIQVPPTITEQTTGEELHSVERGATERQGKPQEDVTVVELGDDPAEQNPLTHSFEKVHTAEEYKGGKKSVDSEDDLTEHADALDELDLREVIRSKKRAKSLYQADIMLQNVVVQNADDHSTSGHLAYDEWDGQRGVYRPKFCRVSVHLPSVSTADPSSIRAVREKHAAQIRKLKSVFDQLDQARVWRNYQVDGPDIDTDAAVDYYATLRSGHTPSEKLYRSRRRSRPQVAMLVLLDTSLSTDAWVGGVRVMDVVKESMMVLGEALVNFEHDVALAAFYSHTHRDCRYLVVKSFAERWSTGYARLQQLEPTGYTRMGPAIRHSNHILSQTPSKKKLLLLISDGKPTDYDHYEGRYGLHDVRQALRETERSGILPFALAIDSQAKHYLPHMFGSGKFEILPNANKLSQALGHVYGRLLHNKS